MKSEWQASSSSGSGWPSRGGLTPYREPAEAGRDRRGLHGGRQPGLCSALGAVRSGRMGVRGRVAAAGRAPSGQGPPEWPTATAKGLSPPSRCRSGLQTATSPKPSPPITSYTRNHGERASRRTAAWALQGLGCHWSPEQRERTSASFLVSQGSRAHRAGVERLCRSPSPSNGEGVVPHRSANRQVRDRGTGGEVPRGRALARPLFSAPQTPSSLRKWKLCPASPTTNVRPSEATAQPRRDPSAVKVAIQSSDSRSHTLSVLS